MKVDCEYLLYNFIVKKGSDKEEYAKDAVTGRAVHRLEDRLTGSLRKVALEPDAEARVI